MTRLILVRPPGVVCGSSCGITSAGSSLAAAFLGLPMGFLGTGMTSSLSKGLIESVLARAFATGLGAGTSSLSFSVYVALCFGRALAFGTGIAYFVSSSFFALFFPLGLGIGTSSVFVMLCSSIGLALGGRPRRLGTGTGMYSTSSRLALLLFLAARALRAGAVEAVLLATVFSILSGGVGAGSAAIVCGAGGGGGSGLVSEFASAGASYGTSRFLRLCLSHETATAPEPGGGGGPPPEPNIWITGYGWFLFMCRNSKFIICSWLSLCWAMYCPICSP